MAMWFCGLSAVTWCSRVVFAFSRDNGMPFSKLWKRVSKTHKTPAAALWLCVVVAFVALIYSDAYSVVTSISVIGLYFSYIIPVFLKVRSQLSKREMARGPWSLGRYSLAINIVAILWVVFISVILSVPHNGRAGQRLHGVAVGLTLWYLLAERRRFTGPAWSEKV